MFDLVVKLLSHYIKGSEFDSQVEILTPGSCSCTPSQQRCLGPCRPRGTPKWSSWHLTWGWPCPSYCRLWWSESEVQRPFCLPPLSLSLSHKVEIYFLKNWNNLKRESSKEWQEEKKEEKKNLKDKQGVPSASGDLPAEEEGTVIFLLPAWTQVALDMKEPPGDRLAACPGRGRAKPSQTQSGLMKADGAAKCI